MEDSEEVRKQQFPLLNLNTLQFAGIQALLPEHPMARLFSMKVMINLHSPSEEDMQIVDGLLDLFPSSLYLLTQKALIHYYQKGW